MTTTVTGDERGMTPEQLIAAEVRAEMGRQRVSQKEIAVEVFGTYPQFIQRRYNGDVPWGAWELVLVANYLKVDVVVFLNAAKPRPTSTGTSHHIDFHGSASYQDAGFAKPANTPFARAA